MIIEYGGGPVGGPTSNDGTGLWSRDAGRYSGVAAGREAVEIETVLTETVPTEVAAGDRLRYAIYPELDAEQHYPATYAAVDLIFDDDSRLSDLGVHDQYRMPFTATGQGEAKILYADQWNDVQVDLGVAAGRRVQRAELIIEPPAGLAGESYTGWIDGPRIEPTPAAPDGSDLTEYVDTRRGSNASGAFSRGNNLPITAWPNGFNFLTPVTDATTHRWPYEYHRANNADNRPELQGLSFSHQPSPWMGDRNQLSIMPVSAAQPVGDPTERSAAFDHDHEVARPDYYRVRLDSGVVAELAPTDHGAVFGFDFPADAAGRHLIIDTIDSSGDFDFDGRALTGWVQNGSEFGRTRMFCYGRFDSTPSGFGPASGGRENARAASFGTDRVELRIATSLISVAQAEHNLELELAGRSFADVRAAANRVWNERLGALRIDDASEPQLRTVYGCLYRLNLYPNAQFENTGTADRPDHRYASPVLPVQGEATATETNAVVRPGRMYVNNGFWDTYRTAWSAYALFYPDLTAELVDGFVQQYRDGGWIARWSSPGYADLMTGTSSDVAFADAYARGVPLPDPLACYDAAVKNATVCPPEETVGRKGIRTGLFAGYTSTEVEESVSWALEGYLNDFGIAEMAARLADDPATPAARVPTLREEADYFRRRSRNYRLLFDDTIDFFQGRRSDGGFARSPGEFDPCSWGGDFTETDGWNFAFHVPQDGNGLAALYGGPGGLADKLDEFFATPERADKPGTYPQVIHEMEEARAVRMGQFGFSNQPAHHIPYVYTAAGRPDRTQQIVREVLQRLFVGEQIGQGYPGDEDNGEMSAWYLLSALGIYPLRVGSDQWTLTAPLFRRAKITPDRGEPIVITAPDQTPASCYVQQVRLNGDPVAGQVLTQDDLTGARLDFDLGSEPAPNPSEPPASITAAGDEPRPLLDLITDLPAPWDVLADDDSGTDVVVDSGTEIAWSVDTAVRPAFYTLTSGDAAGAPSGWRLDGSVDGSNWRELDRRSGEVFGWRRQTRPFAIRPDGGFRHFRLVITDGPDPMRLAEIELLSDR